MSDLIRREDAIKATWQEPSYTNPLNVLTEVRDRIIEIPAAPCWYRVEDELPELGEFGKIVLACNDVGTVNAAFLTSRGKWYAANNTMYDAWTWMPNVTHWMPFPEPPKEDA